MDQNEVDDGFLTDAVERLLRVEPRADLAARVRQRVENAPTSTAWRSVSRGWGFGAVCALAMVVGIALLIRINRPEPVATQLMPNPAETVAPSRVRDEVVPRQDRPIHVEARGHAVAVAPRESIASLGPREPLIPREEMMALRHLISRAQEGRFAYELVGGAVPVADAITSADIVIQPITLLPITVDESLE